MHDQYISLIEEIPIDKGFYWFNSVRILFTRSVSSTQHYLLDEVGNYSSGSLLWSRIQSAGVGRKGRKWLSGSPNGLWFSFLLKGGLEAFRVPIIPVIVNFSLYKTLKRLGVEGVFVVWPNDLYIGSKKLGGTLVDAKTKGSKLEFAVVGVGLNVNQEIQEIDASLHPFATSLKIETGRCFSLQGILRTFCNDFISTWQDAERMEDEMVYNLCWKEAMAGAADFVYEYDSLFVKPVGLDSYGGLLVKLEDGTLKTIRDNERFKKSTRYI